MDERLPLQLFVDSMAAEMGIRKALAQAHH